MDQRLLHIAENLENMIIGPNEPFRFHCTQCGKCCEHREDIVSHFFATILSLIN